MKKIVFIYCLIFAIHTETFSQVFNVHQSGEGVEVEEKGNKVLFYQVAPKSVNGQYERAGYVRSLYSLKGIDLLEDMPEDHPYHHGIFWAWHQVILDNKKIADGWVSDNISWKPVDVKAKTEANKVTIQSELMWVVNKQDSIIQEQTKITVYKSEPRYRIIDFDIHLYALRDSVKIGGADNEKGYGGFCLRIKQPADLTFISEGKTITPLVTSVLAGPWMNFNGSFGGGSSPESGLVLLCFSPGQNQKYPWILRKEKSMQNFVFPGREPISVPKKGLRLRYRIIVYNGEMKTATIKKIYQQYIENSGSVSKEENLNK